MSEHRITASTQLQDIPWLAESASLESQLDALRLDRLEDSYWITTVGDFLSAVLNAGLEAGFEEAFGQPRDRVEDLARALMGMLPQQDAGALQAPGDYALGALLDEDDGMALGAPGTLAGLELPGDVILVDEMPPVFDQGRRGTCVACAASAVNEWYQARRLRKDPLSPQHLYFECKERDGYPGEGTYLRVAAAILEELGECTAATWPYNPSVVPGNEGQGPPPARAAEEASEYRLYEPYKVLGNDIRGMKTVVAGFERHGQQLDGRPFFFGAVLYPSFLGGQTAENGKVLMPLPHERPAGGHAMVVMGYRDGHAPGGGYFIVRNSWGPGWASANPDGPGNCWMPYAYFERYCRGQVYTFLSEEEAELLQASGLTVRKPLQPAGRIEIGARVDDGAPLQLPISMLNRHGISLGTTGSGKTVLCKVICEQALARGIPVIAVDSQGDLASMAQLRDRQEIIREGGDIAIRDQIETGVEPVIFTPESRAGIPVCANPFAVLDRSEAEGIRREKLVDLVAEILVQHLDGLTARQRVWAKSALAKTIRHGAKAGRLERIGDLARLLGDLPPGLARDVERILEPRDLDTLRRALHVLQDSPRRYRFEFGAPLDVDLLIGRSHNPGGKTRLSVLYLNGLTAQRDREEFVSLLAESVRSWMLHNPPQDRSRPQFLLFIDEIGQYVPNPTMKKPICKDILITLFKQGRKYGVAMLGASQSPGDFDYRALGQANATCVGKLKTPQDVRKVEALLAGALGGRDAKETLGGLAQGEFFLHAPALEQDAVRFQSPLTVFGLDTVAEDEIPGLVPPEVRQRFLRWCGLPKPPARTAVEVEIPDESASGPSESAEPPDTLEMPRVATPEQAVEDELLDVLGASPRALTLAQLHDGLCGLRGCTTGVDELWSLLDRLMAERQVLCSKDGRSTVFHLPQQGFLEEPRVFESVLYPVQAPVSETKAGRRLRKEFARREDWRNGKRLAEVRQFSYPLWRVLLAYTQQTWWGLSSQRRQAHVYLDALDGQFLVRDRGGIVFCEHLPPGLDGYTDPFAGADLRPHAPARCAPLVANYRAPLRRERASRLLRQRLDGEIREMQLMFLPVWLGVVRPYVERARSMLALEGVKAGMFEPLALPDLRSLR